MRLTIPNQLTILRILLTPVFIYFYSLPQLQYKTIGTIIFFFAAATDWYDGYVARRFNIITRWGQFMDPLADKILISSALMIFAYLKYLYWWMVILIVSRDFLITFLRLFAIKNGQAIVTSNFAKWKTFTQMSAVFFLLIYLNFPGVDLYHLSFYPPPFFHWVSLLFFFVTIFTVVTGIQYLIENRSHVYELFRRGGKLLTDRER